MTPQGHLSALRKKILLFFVIGFIFTFISISVSLAQQTPDPHVSYLLRKAREEGNVRIIVGVKQTENFSTKENPRIIFTEEYQNSIKNAQEQFLRFLPNTERLHAETFQYTADIVMNVNLETLERILLYPELEDIEEDTVSFLDLYESVPLIQGNVVWAQGYTGEGQTVAILDTGVESAHPFLQGKVVNESCFSTIDATQQVTAICPNGQDRDVGTGSAAPCTVDDGCSHGTHVAGIAVGKDGNNNGTSFHGVAPDANIIAIQIFSVFNNPQSCGGNAPCIGSYTSDQEFAMQTVVNLSQVYDIAAVNLSLGRGKNNSHCDEDSRKNMVDLLRELGIATIASAGNDHYSDGIHAPACISTALSVGATDKSDNIPDYSNSSTILNLLAPGSSILSSIPGGSYDTYSGTSMATPHVTGAFAVMRSFDQDLTVDEIFSKLQSTGKPLTDPKSNVTTPRIDLNAAIGGDCSTPPNIGDWIFSSNCSIIGNVVAPANVIVKSGTVVNIMDGASLDMDLRNNDLLVEEGGGVLIKRGGKVY